MNTSLIDDARNSHASIDHPSPRRSTIADASRFNVEVRATAASVGRHTGRVRIISNESEIESLLAGDVLVWVGHGLVPLPLLRIAGALVAPSCGALSAPATIAREFNIPAVVGVGRSVDLLQDGQFLEVDGGRGLIRAER